MGAIFQNTIKDVTDINHLNDVVTERLRNIAMLEEGDLLKLYVTGLTPALVAVINWCMKNHVKLELLHYNKEMGGYFSQPVFN